MTCLIEADYSPLGEGTPEQLQAHWEVVYNAFCDSIANSQMKSYLMMQGNILFYTTKIGRIQNLIDACRMFYCPELLDVLRSEGYNLPFTEESYLADLDKVVLMAKQFVIKRDQLEMKLNESEGTKPKTQLDYQFFADVLNAIMEVKKVNVDENITTLRFCRLYNDLIAHVEKKNNAR